MPHTIENNATSNFYEILGLPIDLSDLEKISFQIIKTAYRRSLLLHHPDKASTKHPALSPQELTNQNSGTYSIDQITEAYNVLSIPKKRAQYDLELKLQSSTQQRQRIQMFKTGIEIADLDDLGYDELENVWYRSCRCGDERGFLIREAELEEVADEGELGVGCRGCSLWLKVLFGVANEDETVDTAQELGKEDG